MHSWVFARPERAATGALTGYHAHAPCGTMPPLLSGGLGVRSHIALIVAALAVAGSGCATTDAPTQGVALPSSAFAPPREARASLEAESEAVSDAYEAALDADEVMTVVEKRLQTWEDRRDIYRRVAEGKALFARKQINEAFPLLLDTAQLGFKGSQARVGHIYLAGLGDIEQDTVQGVGWLGVASEGATSPGIRNYFNDIWKRIPDTHVPYFEEVVDDYRAKYGAQATGVVCDLDRPLDSFLKRLACFFEGPLPEELRQIMEDYKDNEAMLQILEERLAEAQRVMEDEACRNPALGAAGGCQ